MQVPHARGPLSAWVRDVLVGVDPGDAPDVPEDALTGNEDAQLVCRIDVEPSPVPVYMTPPRVKGGGSPEPEFWVRTGNGTRSLRIDEMLDYHRSRWGRWFRRVFSE